MKLPDSSCIICLFQEINRPSILLKWIDRGHQIVITTQIYEELSNNINTWKSIQPNIKKGHIKVKDLVSKEELEGFKRKYPELGKGELSIIKASLKLKGQGKKYYAVIDDRKARKFAKSLAISLTGTYGLIETLKNKGGLTEKEYFQSLSQLERSKFRISPNILK